MVFYIDPFGDLRISDCKDKDEAAGIVSLIGVDRNANNYFVAELVLSSYCRKPKE